MKQLKAVVSGLVQGVGYRYFVLRNATALGIDGSVRNLRNGDVVVIAQGEQEELSQLLAMLGTGPGSAVVRSVAVDWLESSALPAGFHVQ